jgi:tricorn protease
MPIGNRTWQLLFVLVMLLAGTQLDAQQDYLKRFPAIHDDVIVFTAGEDLWRVASVGGTAERLTFDAGVERYPRFSPDGALLAFTAQFDGNTDVYVMGARGGEITRLTYHPAADEVIGWHAGKNKIIFRSARMGYARYSRLFLISADGSGLEEIPSTKPLAAVFPPMVSKSLLTKTAVKHAPGNAIRVVVPRRFTSTISAPGKSKTYPISRALTACRCG